MAQRRGRPPRGGGDFDDGSPEEPLRRKPGRRPITEMQAEDESSLYFIIRNGKASLQVKYFSIKNIFQSKFKKSFLYQIGVDKIP